MIELRQCRSLGNSEWRITIVLSSRSRYYTAIIRLQESHISVQLVIISYHTDLNVDYQSASNDVIDNRHSRIQSIQDLCKKQSSSFFVVYIYIYIKEVYNRMSLIHVYYVLL